MANTLNLEISAWIKELRFERRLSRSQVAVATGISRRQLGRYESGRPMPLCELARLIEAYQVEPAEAVSKFFELQTHAGRR